MLSLMFLLSCSYNIKTKHVNFIVRIRNETGTLRQIVSGVPVESSNVGNSQRSTVQQVVRNNVGLAQSRQLSLQGFLKIISKYYINNIIKTELYLNYSF